MSASFSCFRFILRLQKCSRSCACDAYNTDGFSILSNNVQCTVIRSDLEFYQSGSQMHKEKKLMPSSVFVHRVNMQRSKQMAMGRKKFNMDPKKVRKLLFCEDKKSSPF